MGLSMGFRLTDRLLQWMPENAVGRFEMQPLTYVRRIPSSPYGSLTRRGNPS
jgi:hypothetical protein